MFVRYFQSFALLFLTPFITLAQSDEPYNLPRIEGSIQIDGLIEEPAWEAIEPVNLVTHWPNFNKEPSEKTEIRIGYNDTYIFVSGNFKDDPNKIQGPTFKRDAWNMTMDQLALILDTFNDNENALIFVVTPTGARVDVTVIDDAEGGTNRTWNTFWDAAATQNEEGWSAEMRIPFSSLRFQDKDGKVSMGLIAYRYIAHKVELDIYPAIPPKWGFWSFVKPSQAKEVLFEGVHSSKPLYVAPYSIGGLGQEFELNNSETAYDRHDDGTYDVGFNLKYGLTNNLTLDVTANTDFAQVEADDQQVNLTRFSLFFPEKRRFFQERASNFEYNLGGSNKLFYSRRIGIHDGRQVRILGGARLVGRAGQWDVGLLNMQTARDGDSPAENFGVVRLRRQVFNSYSYVGSIATSRIDDDGKYNLAYGLDGIFRLFKDDYLTLNWAQTFEDERDNTVASLNATRLRALWARRTFDGFGYEFSLSRAGKFYEPGVGFESREAYTRLGDRVFQGWVMGDSSSIQQFQVSLHGNTFLRNHDGSIETVDLGPALHITWKRGDVLEGDVTRSYEDLRESFELSDDAVVPVGSYTFHNLSLAYWTPRSRLLRTTTRLNGGSFYDGRRFSMSTDPTWVVSRYLELRGFYQFNRIVFSKRNQAYNSHIARFRLQATFNTKITVTAFLQYNSAIDGGIANFRLRYNPKEGNDFYLVYNEGFNTNRFAVDPVLPFTSSRTILAKYTHTFEF